MPKGESVKTVAVIGGGASGIMACLFAARSGCRVVLFEKQNKLGRKISVSGNGRCNIANTGLDILRYHGTNTSVLHSIFARFGFSETVDFFSSIGLPFVEGKKGRLYPASLQASTVVRILEYELAKAGVEVHLHRRVESVKFDGSAFRLVTGGKEEHIFDRVILSAGSSAHPQVGGSTWGYELAESLGHHVIDPFPAILPVNIPLKRLHRLEGVKWDCQVTVREKGKVLAGSVDELLFTKFGISGPATLDVSRAVNGRVLAGGHPEIVIDLFPGHTMEELSGLVDQAFCDDTRTVSFALGAILKERVPEFISEMCGIAPDAVIKNVSAGEKQKIITMMKSLVLAPGQPRPFSEAVVAAGGVDVKEISPVTMESRISPGLYLTGELLDIDGDSGGFNLQFAWSTGALAGIASGK